MRTKIQAKKKCHSRPSASDCSPGSVAQDGKPRAQGVAQRLPRQAEHPGRIETMPENGGHPRFGAPFSGCSADIYEDGVGKV